MASLMLGCRLEKDMDYIDLIFAKQEEDEYELGLTDLTDEECDDE